MVRLSVDVINGSLSYLNPLRERELDLRGNKIPQIENLGSAAEHESIDLTDNDIPAIANLPLMHRLRTLLVARNRISVLAPGIEKSIPNLQTLVLESNRMKELADLDPLTGFPHLEHLVLMGNPVSRKEHYRHWILWRVPSVRYLDYQKVRDAERKKASEMFGTLQDPSDLATQILSLKSREVEMPTAFNNVNGAAESDKTGYLTLTADQRQRIKEKIKNASTLEEGIKLESALRDGKFTSALLD